VLRVWLSHDMQGYDGIESIVYQALSRVMEQVDGGELVVNRGDESRPKGSVSGAQRELNHVHGQEAAFKLAQASVKELIEQSPAPAAAPDALSQNPTQYTSLYLRVQPFAFDLPTASVDEPQGPTRPTATPQAVQFLIYLTEPSHHLSHCALSQAVPLQWLDIWDSNEWVEDLIVEGLRLGVQVVGQEYVTARMGHSSKTVKGRAATTLDGLKKA